MIDVKDEKLSGEAKYQIRDGQGDIVADNVTIEMITPVVQESTPLNKALFDSIKKDLDEKDTKINEVKTHIDTSIPVGLICMWSGSVVPKRLALVRWNS